MTSNNTVESLLEEVIVALSFGAENILIYNFGIQEKVILIPELTL